MYGPQTAYSDELHAEKYRLKGETFRDAMNRVANALKDSPSHYHGFRDALLGMRFMPGGRIQAAMGSPKAVTPYNCFVSGTIPDSFVDSDNPEQSSIADRAKEAARTMRMGGGIGYDFSTLRPEGALIRKLHSQSSGPLGFMPVFDAYCRATSSAGGRRGAQMGVLRVDHPDIWKFIHAKHDETSLTGFNMSVAITDEFMEARVAKRPFALRFEGHVHAEVDPEELWDALMRSTWDFAEPGVLFIDTINRMNNLFYCEAIAATNPCGEQPLPPFGACLLGSFNLVRYIRWDDQGAGYFDYDQFGEDVPHVVRAMDNVVDRAVYPLDQQAVEARQKRRMGLGITGFANASEMLGLPYGESGSLAFENLVLSFLTRHTYLASIELAQEKGSFALYDADLYPAGRFIRSLDEDVQERLRLHGIRNSHLTSIAPTGTISLAADNVSSSIEPVYRWKQRRTVRSSTGPAQVDLYDYGFAVQNIRGRRTAFGEVSAAQHIAVLTTAQRHIDSAVSKTVNCDGSMPWAQFSGLYDAAFEGGAKGCTTYNKDGRRKGLFVEEAEPVDIPFPTASLADRQASTCEIDPATGRRNCE